MPPDKASGSSLAQACNTVTDAREYQYSVSLSPSRGWTGEMLCSIRHYSVRRVFEPPGSPREKGSELCLRYRGDGLFMVSVILMAGGVIRPGPYLLLRKQCAVADRFHEFVNRRNVTASNESACGISG